MRWPQRNATPRQHLSRPLHPEGLRNSHTGTLVFWFTRTIAYSTEQWGCSVNAAKNKTFSFFTFWTSSVDAILVPKKKKSFGICLQVCTKNWSARGRSIYFLKFTANLGKDWTNSVLKRQVNTVLWMSQLWNTKWRIISLYKSSHGNFLAVQWLRLWCHHFGALSLISGQGTKILQEFHGML